MALGVLVCGIDATMGTETNPSITPDKDNTNVSLGIPLSRSSVGMGPEEQFINPSIAASEDYTDNVYESQTGKKSDFITHVTPGLAFKYRAPFWDWDLAYLLDFLYYARNSQGGQLIHNLYTTGHLRVIDNLLFLDISDTYIKVPLDVNRITTIDSPFVNQADQNILTVSPHFEFHPGTDFVLKSGCHYTKTSYMNSSTINSSTPTIDYEEEGIFITTSHELSPRSTFTTNFKYNHDDFETGLSYNQLLPSLGIRYEYAENSFISLEGGYSWFLNVNGKSVNGPYWNAAISHVFDHITVSLNSLVQYNTDPINGATEERDVSATFDKFLLRGSLGLFASYSDLLYIQQDTVASRNYRIGGNIRHELTEKITCNLDLSAERVEYINNTYINSNLDTPYQFNIHAGLRYTLANNLTLNLDYSYTTYRQSLDSSANSTDINRVILGMKKVF